MKRKKPIKLIEGMIAHNTEKEKDKSLEYLEGYYEGMSRAQNIFDKCADDADKLNYDKGCKAVAEKAYEWLKNYAWVEDNKVNHSTLLHDFFKDFRKYM